MLLSHILTKKNYKTPVQETFDFGSYKLQDHRSYIKLVRKTPVLSARHYGSRSTLRHLKRCKERFLGPFIMRSCHILSHSV